MNIFTWTLFHRESWSRVETSERSRLGRKMQVRSFSGHFGPKPSRIPYQWPEQPENKHIQCLLCLCNCTNRDQDTLAFTWTLLIPSGTIWLHFTIFSPMINFPGVAPPSHIENNIIEALNHCFVVSAYTNTILVFYHTNLEFRGALDEYTGLQIHRQPS